MLLGVENGDTREDADVLSKKIANLRVFEDENGKMNLSLLDNGGSLLCISQFTLLADCRKGRRPRIKTDGVEDVKKGIFGADMKVTLLNDGPVTIVLDSKELIK